MKRLMAQAIKKVSALSTITVWATLKYSPVVARMIPENSAILGPNRKLTVKNRTRTVAKAKIAEGILATLSDTPNALKVRARVP